MPSSSKKLDGANELVDLSKKFVPVIDAADKFLGNAFKSKESAHDRANHTGIAVCVCSGVYGHSDGESEIAIWNIFGDAIGCEWVRIHNEGALFGGDFRGNERRFQAKVFRGEDFL